MTTLLTDRQKEIFDFISLTLEQQGYPPSLREIAGHFGLVGTRAVEKHLIHLEQKGVIRRGTGARAIEVIGHTSRSVPILGQVAAGQPIFAEENLLGTLAVDPSVARWKRAFFLKVRGESMTGAGILPDDLVLVKPQPDAESGEIVVAMVEGEATVKRLVKQKEKILLQPANSLYQPIVISPPDILKILGKVTAVFRLSL